MLIAIAVFKLLKALLLIVIGFGLHHLLHRDAEEIVRHWAHAVRVDPDSHYLHAAIAKLTGVSDRKLEALSIGTFLYAALFLTEGIGLMLKKRWAEYMTVISTSGLLPVEVYELVVRPHLSKVVLLIANLLIVAYLIASLYRTRRRTAAVCATAATPNALQG